MTPLISLFISFVVSTVSGVSIKLKWAASLRRVGDGIEKGSQGPYCYGGMGACPHPPKKNLKSGSSETLFPAFWASNCI